MIIEHELGQIWITPTMTSCEGWCIRKKGRQHQHFLQVHLRNADTTKVLNIYHRGVMDME